jgi:hypothetical protein
VALLPSHRLRDASGAWVRRLPSSCATTGSEPDRVNDADALASLPDLRPARDRALSGDRTWNQSNATYSVEDGSSVRCVASTLRFVPNPPPSARLVLGSRRHATTTYIWGGGVLEPCGVLIPAKDSVWSMPSTLPASVAQHSLEPSSLVR